MKALSSFDLSDNQISQLMSLHRLTTSSNAQLYIEQILHDQSSLTPESLSKIKSICAYLSPLTPFSESQISALVYEQSMNVEIDAKVDVAAKKQKI